MKKIIYIIFLFPILLGAQDISVKSFNKRQNDLDARIHKPIKDQNGEKCAIIKVVASQKDFKWEGDALGIVKAVYKTGEYWLYVPHGAKRLTIKHEKLGILRDYRYPSSIKEATVYELVLTTGKVIVSVVDQEVATQWVVISSDPVGASLYINEEYKGLTPFQQELVIGEYNYSIRYPMYENTVGTFELTEVESKIIEKTLNPDFRKVSIKSIPEDGALVFIDGKNSKKTTPCTIDDLQKGKRIISLKHKWYEPTSYILVVDDNTEVAEIMMSPIYGFVNIINNEGFTVYIDKVQLATKEVKKRLTPGYHTIETKESKYYNYLSKVEVLKGQTKNISISLKQKNGILKVHTIPYGAEIILNGKSYGSSPKTLKNILIGEYDLILNKKGYQDKKKQVTIIENQIISISEKLNKKGYQDKKKQVTIIENQIISISEKLSKEVADSLGYPAMVLVAGGSFTMGDTFGGGRKNEKSTLRVKLNDFYIGKTEVTVAQYNKYCKDVDKKMPNKPNWGWNDKEPIVNVSWNEAIKYCEWLSRKTGKLYTLPTESQWEYAARGGDKSKGYIYSGSDNLHDVAWYSENCRTIREVSTKQSNELGLYDMSGNVWEWCSNLYKKDYSNNFSSTDSDSFRVIRGGSWNNDNRQCRLSYRDYYFDVYENYKLGFRVVLLE